MPHSCLEAHFMILQPPLLTRVQTRKKPSNPL